MHGPKRIWMTKWKSRIKKLIDPQYSRDPNKRDVALIKSVSEIPAIAPIEYPTHSLVNWTPVTLIRSVAQKNKSVHRSPIMKSIAVCKIAEYFCCFHRVFRLKVRKIAILYWACSKQREATHVVLVALPTIRRQHIRHIRRDVPFGTKCFSARVI